MPKINMKPTLEKIRQEISLGLPRNYLGASEIGEQCERKLWYKTHEPIETKVKYNISLLFDLGHKIEDQVIDYLERIGFETKDKQSRFSLLNKRFNGHCDLGIKGFIECSSWHVADVKSFSDKRFRQWQKEGVKKFEPKYYVQLMLYAYAFNYKKCVIIGYNKNTSEIDYERFNYDSEVAQHAINKARRVLDSKEVLPREYPHSNFYKCKWCDYQERCWDG